jgi:hypothetical protein
VTYIIHTGHFACGVEKKLKEENPINALLGCLCMSGVANATLISRAKPAICHGEKLEMIFLKK